MNNFKILILALLIFCHAQIAPVQAQTKPLPRFKIGYIPITDHLLLGISQHNDAQSFKHFSVEPIRFPDMGTITEGLRSANLDGGFIFVPLALQARLKKTPIKVIALAHRNGSALIVRVRPGINTVNDLKGTTIAIPHRFSTHNMLLHTYLSDANLVYGKDVSVVEMLPPEMPAALAGGSIDGYIVAEPIGARAEVMGIGKVLVLSRDIWQDHPDCIVVFREDIIARYPEAIQELVTSVIRAGIYAEDHREQAVTIGTSFLGQPEPAMRKALLETKERVTFHNLIPINSEFTRIQDYMGDKMGLFPERANVDQLIDSSFAKAAYEHLKLEVNQKKE